MADNMGVPEEQLLSIMYKAEAARAAKNEVQKAMKEQEEANQEDADAGGADAGAQQQPAAASDNGQAAKKLGADASQQSIDAKPAKKSGDVFGSTNKLQRDLSVQTLQSKATAATLEGSLIAPPFKFGMQRQYRELQDMDSRQRERKKAETTLKEGSLDQSAAAAGSKSEAKLTLETSVKSTIASAARDASPKPKRDNSPTKMSETIVREAVKPKE